MGRKRSIYKTVSKTCDRLYEINPKFTMIGLGVVLIILGLLFIGKNSELLDYISAFCLFVGILSIVVTILTIRKEKKKEKALNEAVLSTGINQIDKLNPYQFEEWIARFLKLNGFDARTTKKSGDFGADVIAKKDGVTYAISCKKYTGNLGVKCVQEIMGAMDYYKANVGWVVSTAPAFSKQAYDLASKRDIKLYNKEDLILMLKKLQDTYNK